MHYFIIRLLKLSEPVIYTTRKLAEQSIKLSYFKIGEITFQGDQVFLQDKLIGSIQQGEPLDRVEHL